MAGLGLPADADDVTDWNSTIRAVIKHDGTHLVHKANPGWSTRSIAMVNTAIYDVFQSIDRTHQPFLYDQLAMDPTSRSAAVHQAAYELLLHCYPDEGDIITDAYEARMQLVPDDATKTAGIALGSAVAAACIASRQDDHSGDSTPYMEGTDPGEWRSDPWHLGQQAWGPGWKAVTPFAVPNSTDFVNALPGVPDLNSPEYTDAFEMVRDYGDLDSSVRDQEQEEIGLFWAYDVPSVGPPPVLFVRNLEEIAAQAGNTPEENARMFAMASVAQADAAIAAWDAKFTYNFWRPVTAIQEAGDGGPGDADGNPDTVAIDDWRPLGAPGTDYGSSDDDFTPPFPAWTSGHATMGGAIFKSLELFYGTNLFDEIDGIDGDDAFYTLTSEEPGSGFARDYTTFTQTAFLDVDTEDSPEGENGMSRIYLGIHWIFDQRDGITLGNDIAQYVSENYFQPVPEPSTLMLAGLGAVALVVASLSRRKR